LTEKVNKAFIQKKTDFAKQFLMLGRKFSFNVHFPQSVNACVIYTQNNLKNWIFGFLFAKNPILQIVCVYTGRNVTMRA